MSTPMLSIIIVSYNAREVLRECLVSLYGEITSSRLTSEVILIDNASRDGSAAMVERDFPGVRLIASSTNLGFAAANNLGFAIARGDFIVLLNPDAQLAPGALANAVESMSRHPEAGLAGGRLLDEQGQDQPSARHFPSLLNEFLVLSGLAARFPHSRLFGRFDRTWADPELAAQVDWVPGAFTIMRAEALRELGGFDERFFLYYEEVDLCRRFKAAGWQVWYWPSIRVHHIGGVSSRTVEHEAFSSAGSQLTLWRMRSGLLYYRKHHGFLNTWLVARLEAGWHGLRAIKARLGQSQPGRDGKLDESRRIVELVERAWTDTLGGRVSPPRPW
jgi:GT2 family glycosyltransferase